jgi:hypothetical protein
MLHVQCIFNTKAKCRHLPVNGLCARCLFICHIPSPPMTPFPPPPLTHCTLGYSDFHILMGFTSKKMPNNNFKNEMFVKKVFQSVKQFLANLHSSSSKKYSYMYSMTPKILFLFLHMSIKNTQNFMLISKS